MDLNTLSDEQLAANLRTLLQHSDASTQQIDDLQSAVQSLQVHRVELEMQNRALREMQAELEQAVRRYSDLYDHLPVGYVTVTARGRITEANAVAAEWMNLPRDRLIGGYLSRFVGGEEEARLAAHLQACLESAEAGAGTVRCEVTIRPDGRGVPLDVQLASRVTSSPGGEQLIRIAITDISPLKRTQRALQEINKEQEAFNHSISHDLRAPLVTISNYSKLLQSDFTSYLPAEGQAMLKRIEAAAMRMETLLLRLLEYSAIPREDIVLAPVNLDELVGELLIQLRGVIQDRKAEIAVARPLPSVKAQRDILGQALSNLITNALKYTAPGRPPKVKISAEMKDERVVLAVADEGIGIPAAYHERVFRIFERLHGYSAYPGTGIGLAIVRRAADRLQGRVWVQSDAGKGSTFFLELQKA